MGDQLEKLAQFIMDEIPGEPSRSEGAGDCAIRLLRQRQADIDAATAAEQVRVLEAVRWAFAAYDGDLDKIAQHCFGMSFEWTRRLRDEELDRVREEATKAERERWVRECTKSARRLRSIDRRVSSPVAVSCANVLESLREDMGKEGDNDV